MNIRIAAVCVFFAWSLANGSAATDAAGTTAEKISAASVFANARTTLLHDQSAFPQEWRRTATLQFGDQTGSVVCRKRGSESICATKAGIFSEVLYKKGLHFYRHDLSGLSRELRGSLRAHERTLTLITDGTFLAHPEWATVETPAASPAPPTQSVTRVSPSPRPDLQWVIFHPPGGERMRIAFDAEHFPVEIRSQGDFGTQKIRFSDYRAVDGVMWPFTATIDNPNVPLTEIRYTEIVTGDAGSDAISAEYPHSLRARVNATATVALEERNDHLYAPVRIGGRTYRFLVDSGSQAIILDPRIARDLPGSESSTIGVRASEHTASAKLIPLHDLTVGGARFPGQTAIVSDLGTTADGSSKIDGILGFPFFAQAAVTIDLGAKTMTVGAPRSLTNIGKRCPVVLDRGIPEIDAALLSGPRGAFVLDTGSSDTVLLYAPFAKRGAGALFVPGTMREKTYGIGGSVAARDAALEGVKICGMPWRKNLPAHLLTESKGAFANRHLAGSIGTAYFGDAILGFDLQAGVVYIKSNAVEP